MSAPAQETPLLQVRHLYKSFPIFGEGLVRRKIGEVKAVNDVSFDLRRGETLGLVGESGCGKTTAARSVLRAIRPNAGEVVFQSEGGPVDLAKLSDAELKPLRREMQMIFQDPFASLNPRMTVGDIVSEPLVIHRVAAGSELQDRVADALSRVGLKPEHRSRYPHAFSGGQRQRIGIARALILRPALVVADEAVSALDVSVQAQVINLLKDLQEEMGLTYLFIAHDLSVVRHLCNRAAVMYCGKIVEIGPVEELFEAPRHPYTRALLSAVPSPDPDQRLESIVPGETADPANAPPGCSFHTRCPFALQGRCDQADNPPTLRELSPGHHAACLRADDITLKPAPIA